MEKNNHKKRILVRVDGSKNIGLGHVYNMITVLDQFKNFNILLVMNKNSKLGSNKLHKFHYTVKFFTTKNDLKKIILTYKPNIIFNDILNTSCNYMKFLKKFNCFLVNFEDLGEGRKIANLVFNPIYYTDHNTKNEFYGHKFACIRKEFRNDTTKKTRKIVSKVVITFGGTDPTNKTKKVLNVIYNYKLKKIKFNIILGLGYSKRENIRKLCKSMIKEGFKINLIEKTDNIAKYVKNNDFAISSNGRTVFEIVALKIPIISIAVNKREMKHSFVRFSKTGFHLDVHARFNDLFVNSLMKMLDEQTRKKFLQNIKKIDLINGNKRVSQIIKIEYRKWIKMNYS